MRLLHQSQWVGSKLRMADVSETWKRRMVSFFRGVLSVDWPQVQLRRSKGIKWQYMVIPR